MVYGTSAGSGDPLTGDAPPEDHSSPLHDPSAADTDTDADTDAGTGAFSVEEAESGEAQRARDIVLRSLTSSAKTRHQLQEKLAQREISGAVAARVLDRYEELGLVDDAAYAESFVRSRAQSRRQARSALKRDLQRKGVAAPLIDQALLQRTEEDEHADARELVRAKLPAGGAAAVEKMDLQQRQKLTRRLVSMLGRRGYSPGVAFSAVKDVMGGLEQEQVWDDGAGI